MSTNHARIAAILLAGDGGPGEGGDDVINVTTQIANNFSLLADLSGVVRFTTLAGKPVSNNFAGKIAQEIDTGNLFIHDGAQWQILQGTIHNCTRLTRPTAGSYTLYTGLQIYETDTKMKRIWNGTRWQWVGGVKQIRTVNLPVVTPPLTTNWTFPVVAGSGYAAQTNDPDSAMSISTTGGSQGIKCEVAGIYRATIVVTSSINAADAVMWIVSPGGDVTYGPGVFGKNGATTITTPALIAAAGDIFIPAIYVYSGSSVSFTGKLYVELISEI